MAKYVGMREEAVKNNVAQDYFKSYKHTDIIGNIDFCIAKSGLGLFVNQEDLNSILWAEAKKGIVADINESFVQLILTIGKAKTFNSYLPPYFLGAFDAEKIAFIPYHTVAHIFTQNDFNWNVTPSNHGTKEFIQLYKLVKDILDENSLVFNFEENDSELKLFIKNNFENTGNHVSKIQVDKNNFTYVYQRWTKEVKPTIKANWDLLNKTGIISADFFLADLLSENNKTLKDKLYVLLNEKNYEIDRKIDDMGFEESKKVRFTDDQKAHKRFWNIYERPPKKEYWNFIVSRRDLLVPQDIRERKGSFFTPQIWVEKSQQYLADVLGADWQDEYYIWDCCAGTGNLLNGLTNYRNVWASTLDKADVDVMKDRINSGWKMFENHVFQFDFLNDDFSKCPDELQEILNSENKRKKLIVYINPPYAEATNAKTVTGSGENKDGVATLNKTYSKYKNIIGAASNEIFSQFFIRIYKELDGCILGEFSKLKHLQAQNFSKFRSVFQAKLESYFLVPAKTFDNVTGEFPIGFFVWNTAVKEPMENKTYSGSVFNEKGTLIYTNKITVNDKNFVSINKWIKKYDNAADNIIGYMENPTPDFQNNDFLCIINNKGTRHNNYYRFNQNTMLEGVIYFAVREVIPKTWLNDRVQFLSAKDGWQNDINFQTDCLIYTLFHGQNRITCEQGINHWIPFTEYQVGCKKTFKSNFMSDFLAGKYKQEVGDMYGKKIINDRVKLSEEAQEVYNAGLNLWKYYHSKINVNPDASFYDIRKYFQGIDNNGKMNKDSNDEYYMELITELRSKMKVLAKVIEPKVYEYGFLK